MPQDVRLTNPKRRHKRAEDTVEERVHLEVEATKEGKDAIINKVSLLAS
jgi:hypothetical protein